MSNPSVITVQMRGIWKRFPGIVANAGVDFELIKGEIHTLLGENGAGKTTLMNVLYGLEEPDEGEIILNGKHVHFKSARDAIHHGLGMVHQHFMLVQRFTVAENITLGMPSQREPRIDDPATIKDRLIQLSERYGLQIHPDAEIWTLSVGEQQRVEILKALYRGAGNPDPRRAHRSLDPAGSRSITGYSSPANARGKIGCIHLAQTR